MKSLLGSAVRGDIVGLEFRVAALEFSNLGARVTHEVFIVVLVCSFEAFDLGQLLSGGHASHDLGDFVEILLLMTSDLFA